MTLINEDVIEFYVEDLAQLFHTVAPFPFRERDLDREAEDYIVGLMPAQFAVGVFFEDPLKRLVEQSQLILGRVANWRPLARRRDLYRRLSTAIVEPRPFPVPVTTAGSR